jgi:hypothetical protein
MWSKRSIRSLLEGAAVPILGRHGALPKFESHRAVWPVEGRLGLDPQIP